MPEKNRNSFENLNLKSKGSLKTLLFYVTLLCLYITAVAFHRFTFKGSGSHKFAELRVMGKFRHYFFTGWNFGLQIIFLLLAVIDETSKLINFSILQRPVERTRRFLFTALVFPSSLLVMTVFWGIWHIDRELIFPKAIDEFYPTWLNHTLHTLIIVPLVVEIICQSGNKNYKVSKVQAISVLMIYITIYQILYLSVYFQHGIWLYPIYGVLNWIERIAFILFQFALLLGYQQVGFALLTRRQTNEAKKKLT